MMELMPLWPAYALAGLIVVLSVWLWWTTR
jgi:hypothetical protein